MVTELSIVLKLTVIILAVVGWICPHPDLHVEVLIPSGVSPFLETGSFPADVIKSR